jgi:hypothetical protein
MTISVMAGDDDGRDRRSAAEPPTPAIAARLAQRRPAAAALVRGQAAVISALKSKAAVISPAEDSGRGGKEGL